MSFSSSSSSSDRRRKAISLSPDDFTAWEMQFQAHVGYAEWKLFQEEEPVVDEAHLFTLLDGGVAGGGETRASRSYEKTLDQRIRNGIRIVTRSDSHLLNRSAITSRQN